MPAIALIIGALIAIIDQVIKLLVVNYLKPVGTVNVIGDVFKLTYVENDLEKATVKLVLKMAKKSSNFITLFYGEGVTEEQAEKTAELIKAKLPDSVDVNVAYGGQPVYYYLISVE